VAYRDSSFTSASALTLNATKPALTQPGDILYTYFFTDGGLNSGITLTPPTGWTLVPGSNQGANTGAPDGWTSWVYWKMAGPSEASTYAWTIAGIPATDLSAYIIALSGRKASPPVISHGTVNTTGNATPVTVSDTGITPLNGDDVLVFATGDITIGTAAWSFGSLTNYTQRQNTQNSFNVGTCYTRENVDGTATGTLSVTLTRNSGTGTSGWGIFVMSVPKATVSPTAMPTFRLRKGGNIKLVRRPGMPVVFVETVTSDKWYTQDQLPVRSNILTSILSPSSFFVPVISQAETITVDKWYQPASQPFNKILYRQTGGEYRFEVPRTILLSDWFNQTSQPYFSKFRLIPFGEYRFETPREILITDWFQPVSQPYIIRRTNTNFGEYRFEVPREILLSDWFNDTSQPVRNILRQLLGGESRVEIIIPAEIVTLDKWYQETQQPYFKRLVQISEWEFLVEIVATPVPPESTGHPILVEKHKLPGGRKIYTQDGRREEEEELILLLVEFLLWQ
jgi:hypothetical protein